MVDSCCAPGCHNSRHTKGRAFYRIPKDPERRRRWITAIKRARSEQKKTERWEPKGNGFRLCSDHFTSGKKSNNPLLPDYVPSIFKHVPSPEKSRRRMQLDVFNRRQKTKLQRREQAETPSAAPVTPPTACPQDGSKHPNAGHLTEKAPVEESTQKELENDFQPIPDDNDDPATPPCSSEN
ncbi:THAP domain-containing protein 11-like isoform X4 [Epinephelus moara]|nr:THAP domain-containing protein 11-like isoform X3 [Epinephelus moara]XP_049928825.1 THAP domain-containing protein 11-like isoform X4 [Epinephelus moara]